LHITTRIELGDGDNLAYTPDAAAAQVLAALGGNPTNDYSVVTVVMPATEGTAGTAPPPIETPPTQE